MAGSNPRRNLGAALDGSDLKKREKNCANCR